MTVPTLPASMSVELTLSFLLVPSGNMDPLSTCLYRYLHVCKIYENLFACTYVCVLNNIGRRHSKKLCSD